MDDGTWAREIATGMMRTQQIRVTVRKRNQQNVGGEDTGLVNKHF